MNNDKPTLRLLVLDDDLAFYGLVKGVAESHGFEVAAPDALRIFKSIIRSWPPTLIFMDLKIANTDGIEILHDLAVIKCTASIVLASSLDSRTLDSALRVGTERGLKMAGVLRKPVQPHELNDLLVRHTRVE